MGVRSLKVTARHLNNAGCCYEYTIVSVSRIARRYTIQCCLPNTHTVQRARGGWEHEGGREGEGGSDDDRQGESVRGGREGC